MTAALACEILERTRQAEISRIKSDPRYSVYTAETLVNAIDSAFKNAASAIAWDGVPEPLNGPANNGA